MNRIRFLKTLGAAMLALPLLPALAQDGYPSQERP